MTYPPFADLLALSKKQNRSNKHKKLRSLLLKAWRAEACLGDLLQAKDCCECLRNKVDQTQRSFAPHEQTTVKALLTTAVILYARATSTGGKAGERGSIQLNSARLTKDEKEDHDALIALRNQSLAHVNPEHKVGARLWHKIVVFAVPNSKGRWIPAALTNETTWNRETLERLERILPVAIEIVEEKFRLKLNAVEEGLAEAKISEKTFQKHLFDPVEVFGSDEVVKRILSSRGKVSDRFWVNE